MPSDRRPEAVRSPDDDRAAPPRPRRKPRTTRRTRGSPKPTALPTFRAFGVWLLGLLGALLLHGWRRFARWHGQLSNKARWRFAIAAWIVVLTAPVWLINTAVAYYGRTVVFPLSPFFLREKAIALATYAAHRPFCAFVGHPDMAPVIARAEARQRLPRGLLAAVVQVESAGRPHRISSAGAMGPGQLMPGTARQLGVSDPFDTEANVDGAARLLASHLARYRGRLPLAIAAYNAGPGAVRGRIPQNGQTPNYVAKVMRTYASLRPPARARAPARRARDP